MPLIVAASPTEANALQVRLPAGRVHCIGVGKVAAALSAQRLILEQKARAMLLVGTAGGIAPWLEPLDIVIASASVQWDVDLTAVNGGECGQLNDGRRFFAADPQAQLLAEQAASLLGYRAYRGSVASGDHFVADRSVSKWIRSTFDAHAVDVETAAVAQTAADLGIPFLAVRVISDKACFAAPSSYRSLAEIASARAAQIGEAVAQSWAALLDHQPRRMTHPRLR